MPSIRACVPAVSTVAIACLVGCVDDGPPMPDVSNLKIVMSWQDDDTRHIAISIANPDIPCDDVEEGFLGESAVQCTSGKWTLTVDGSDVQTSRVTCYSAHDGLFGHVPKRCNGGTALTTLQDHGGEDVEIVARSGDEERRIVVHGVRRTYPLVQEVAFSRGGPGVVRVDDLALVSDVFAALYSQNGGTVGRDEARVAERGRLHVSPFSLANGSYNLRVLALASRDGATIAVPLEGTFVIGP